MLVSLSGYTGAVKTLNQHDGIIVTFVYIIRVLLLIWRKNKSTDQIWKQFYWCLLPTTAPNALVAISQKSDLRLPRLLAWDSGAREKGKGKRDGWLLFPLSETLSSIPATGIGTGVNSFFVKSQEALADGTGGLVF